MTEHTLSTSPKWADITPIPQNDGPNPLVAIMYDEQYREAMDYFRAVAAAGEKSERVLELTEAIIRMSPSHYTVWQYRFSTLLHLKADLAAELRLMDTFAQENLKSYQVWHHRLLLMTALCPDPTAEIDFIHTSLQPDPKNYHTWAYLHWVYSHFSPRITAGQWKSELAWCTSMLEADGRNNSAWGWRWFLCFSRPGARKNAEVEIAYAVEAIHKIPHNASAWNYLRGVVDLVGAPRGGLVRALVPYLAGSVVEAEEGLGGVGGVWPEREGPVSGETPTPVPLALEFLAEALEEGGRGGDAALVYGQLGEVDAMRGAYWEMRRTEVV